MPYVSRNESGKVNGVYAVPQPGYGEEFLPDDNPEVVAYLNPPTTTIQPISSRQFWMQMANANIIDESDAVKALGGDIPNVIKQFINTLPALQRFPARMFFEAPTFERRSRIGSDLKACFAITDAVVDQFFRDASAL